MKTLASIVISLFVVVAAHADSNAERVALLIAGADSVTVRGESERKPGQVVTLSDLKWIQGVSDAIARCPLEKPVACMCGGWRTAYFYKQGVLQVSVAAIHGNQLRIGGCEMRGDFPIDEEHWKAVKAALETKHEAN